MEYVSGRFAIMLKVTFAHIGGTVQSGRDNREVMIEGKVGLLGIKIL